MVGLNSVDVVQPESAGIEVLVEAVARQRSVALERVPWVSSGLHAVPKGAIDPVDGGAILEIALSASDSELETFLDDGDGRPVAETPSSGRTEDSARIRTAAARGGVVLGSASRFSDDLARLCDLTALALGAPVSACLVSGHVPGSAAALRNGNHFVVFPLDASAQVFGALDVVDPTDATTQVAEVGLCEAQVTHSIDEIQTPVGSSTLVLVGRRTTVDDAVAFAVRKAGHWPLLRADLPYDLDAPALTYSSRIPVDPVELLLDSVAAIEQDRTLEQACAWTRALVRAAPRPTVSSWPTSVENWLGRTVRGRFPGGIGALDFNEDGRSLLVFSGCVVGVAHHVRDGILTDLVGPKPLEVVLSSGRCDVGDPLCDARAVDVLGSLGVVELVE